MPSEIELLHEIRDMVAQAVARWPCIETGDRGLDLTVPAGEIEITWHGEPFRIVVSRP